MKSPSLNSLTKLPSVPRSPKHLLRILRLELAIRNILLLLPFGVGVPSEKRAKPGPKGPPLSRLLQPGACSFPLALLGMRQPKTEIMCATLVVHFDHQHPLGQSAIRLHDRRYGTIRILLCQSCDLLEEALELDRCPWVRPGGRC